MPQRHEFNIFITLRAIDDDISFMHEGYKSVRIGQLLTFTSSIRLSQEASSVSSGGRRSYACSVANTLASLSIL
jgi:hypothetical protein